MPRNCSANFPGEAIHAITRRCAVRLRSTPRTVPPTSVRPERLTLKRGRRNPLRGTDACFALAWGHVVMSGASPLSPSALCGHPSHYITIPDSVEVRGDGTSPRPLLCLVRPPVSDTLESARGRPSNGQPLHRHPRGRSWMDTGCAM
jgi:hypothetical protein